MMRVFLTLLCAIFAANTLHAQTMTAVAVSPDGKTVLAAGDNRTLYTLDAETLDVIDRKYIPAMVRELTYSADGSRIFMRMDNRDFRAHSAGSFKKLYEVENISSMSIAADTDRIALLEDNYNAGVLHIVRGANGKTIRKIDFPETDIEQVAISADGSFAMVLTDDDKSEDEPKESPPSELKGYDKYVFRQQNDGYTSQILNVDLSKGTHTIADTFYRIGYPFQVRMLGDKMAFINSATDSGLVGTDGAAQLINLGDSYVAAGRISDDGTSIVLTSGNDITYHALNAGVAAEASREMEAADIDGPSERVTAMDEAADGTMYMVTSGYRIWKIAPDAAEPVVRPVF